MEVGQGIGGGLAVVVKTLSGALPQLHGGGRAEHMILHQFCNPTSAGN